MGNYQVFKILTVQVWLVAKGHHSQPYIIQNEGLSEEPAMEFNIESSPFEVPNMTSVESLSTDYTNESAIIEKRLEITTLGVGNGIAFVVSMLPILILLAIIIVAKMNEWVCLFRPAYEPRRSVTTSRTLSLTTVVSSSSHQTCHKNPNNLNNVGVGGNESSGSDNANRLSHLDRNTIIHNNLELAAKIRTGNYHEEDYDSSSSEEDEKYMISNTFQPNYSYAAAVGAELPDDELNQVHNYNLCYPIHYNFPTSQHHKEDIQKLKQPDLETISEDESNSE